MKFIDLRSDTVTLPTQEMRKAISNAELGDDVFQEDPTINQLESIAALLLGKDAALLVPSGTMGNLVSILVHCERGTELILGDRSHTFMYEAGGISAFGGIHSRQLKNQDDGTMDIDNIKSAIRGDNVHFPRTSLICLENTHNMCFGAPISIEYTQSVADIAHENNIKLHIDGARIFNATVALDTDIKELVNPVDSVTFCLSKGLSAPVGSIICGSESFINSGRRIRKALGGGMRQAGIIAAAGIVSLETMIDQLKTDHNNATQLANGISSIPELGIVGNGVKTNIIYFKLHSTKLNGQKLVNSMAEKNIHFFELETNRFRLVTHSGIQANDINFVLENFESILSQYR